MRKMIQTDPFLVPPPDDMDAHDRWHTGRWPAAWISHPTCSAPPCVTAYRRRFTLDAPETIRVHVTADERYMLYLDGERVGRGPERGDRRNWFFESYDLTPEVGEHVLVAVVWALGDQAPLAQFSVRRGFLLAAEDERWHEGLTTGVATWRRRRSAATASLPTGSGSGPGPISTLTARLSTGGCDTVRAVGGSNPWSGPTASVVGGTTTTAPSGPTNGSVPPSCPR